VFHFFSVALFTDYALVATSGKQTAICDILTETARKSKEKGHFLLLLPALVLDGQSF
jgi:hypothetical protein